MGTVQPPSHGETIAKAALAAIPYVGGSLAIVYEDVRDRHLARVRGVVEDIDARAGTETLEARLRDSEVVEVLFLEGVEAASRTGLAAKRRLLAKVIANAVRDEAAVDTSQLIVGALKELDSPHLAALTRLCHAEDSSPGEPADTEGNDTTIDLSRREPVPVIAALIRTGTVLPATLVGGGVAVYRVADFGRTLLADLTSEGF